MALEYLRLPRNLRQPKSLVLAVLLLSNLFSMPVTFALMLSLFRFDLLDIRVFLVRSALRDVMDFLATPLYMSDLPSDDR